MQNAVKHTLWTCDSDFWLWNLKIIIFKMQKKVAVQGEFASLGTNLEYPQELNIWCNAWSNTAPWIWHGGSCKQSYWCGTVRIYCCLRREAEEKAYNDSAAAAPLPPTSSQNSTATASQVRTRRQRKHTNSTLWIFSEWNTGCLPRLPTKRT